MVQSNVCIITIFIYLNLFILQLGAKTILCSIFIHCSKILKTQSNQS